MIKCICINNKNKPDTLSKTEWLVLNEIYTLEGLILNPDTKEVGIVLKELKIHDDTHFKCFDIFRFGFIKEDVLNIIDMIDANKEHFGFDGTRLLENKFFIGDDFNDFENFKKSLDDDMYLGEL